MSLKHLVVVVPGIGGSNLVDGKERRVWGHDLGALAMAPFRAEELAIDNPLVPAGLLRVSGALPWTGVASYGRLIAKLKRRLQLSNDDVSAVGPQGVLNPAASLVEFGYDFRQPMADSAGRLRAVINSVRGNRRVIVVGHSMGGLVARWWWGVLGGHRVCDGLVTVGTPHRGAPKALDWLVNGVSLGLGPVGAASRHLLTDASQVLQGWPSVYELLPRYRVIKSEAGILYPHEWEGAGDWFRDRAGVAYRTHLELETACVAATEESPQSAFMAFYATGHGTLSSAFVDRDGRLRVSKDDPDWFDTKGWKGGDGTVPSLSATPVERESVNERTWSPEHHLAMADSDRAVAYVAQFEQDGKGNVRGGSDEDEAWIGLDYDVVRVETSTALGLRLNGAEVDDGVVPQVILKAEPGDGGDRPADAMRLEVAQTADGGWEAGLPGLPPGSYRFTVSLDHVPGVDRVETSSLIGVVEA
ncbi:PGAP1-like protein [Tessaracoccus bendigoensis DSM 12906]|uniref:PGAP1-like protein n=1 Tax=Tessaracoccus bendigoensis DSM 12906 TaxID=1123357 RepID=A0A1M6FQE0_9ACTN|nr:hypothetical protein [Tessaracoccus bendigoensis]SHI99875.1 PGAP1-like protein [Tessaracoccus bendigoensis DSM 12906]